MGMQYFIKIYQTVQGIGPVSLFSEFEPRQNLDLSQISFDNLIGYVLSISMYMHNFITIFLTVLEIGPFSLFQNLELSIASTNKKCQFAISWARSCQYQWVCKILSKYTKCSRNRVSFTFFFRIWTSAKPRPIPNTIWQSHWLHLVNIPMRMQNFITIFHTFQEIAPLSLFHNLELGTASTNEKCHFAVSWARSCQYQCLRNSLSKYSTQFKR